MTWFTPNHHHLINTILMNIYVLSYFFNSQSIYSIFIAILTSIIVDSVCEYLIHKRKTIKTSSIIAALAVTVSTRSPYPYEYILIMAIPIAFKYFLKMPNGKHVFNPSNLAILLGALYTNLELSRMAVFPHFDNYFFIFIYLSGVMLLLRVNKILNHLILLTSFIIINVLILNTSFLYNLRIVTNPLYLLFMFFIANDPMSTPSSVKNGAIYQLSIAASFFLLQLWKFNFYLNLPLALFITSVFYFIYICRKKIITWQSFYLLVLVCLILFKVYPPLKMILSPSSEINNKNNLIPKNYSPSDYENYFSPIEFQQSLKSNKSFSKKLNFNYVQNIKFKRHKNAITIPFILKNNPHAERFATGSFAPTASGDINSDGLLDIVMSHQQSDLKIFINKGNHQFIDETRNYLGSSYHYVEQIALIDIDNDNDLDLFLLFGDHTNGVFEILEFDKNKYIDLKMRPTLKYTHNKYNGDIDFIDLNNDGRLDFYISMGGTLKDIVVPLHRTLGSKDHFYISKNKTWIDGFEDYFGNSILSLDPLMGMSVMFSDYNQDGFLDLLIGNSFQGPTLIFKNNSNSNFKETTSLLTSLQNINTMSFFTSDFNNDSKPDFFDGGSWGTPQAGLYLHFYYSIINSISNEKWTALFLNFNETKIKQNEFTFFSQNVQDGVLKENNIYSISNMHVEWGNFINDNKEHSLKKCQSLKNSYTKSLCESYVYYMLVTRGNNRTYCEHISTISLYLFCVTSLSVFANDFSYKEVKLDHYPIQVPQNILSLSDKNNYKSIKVSSYTNDGVGWAFYPFDINNDGYLDIVSTTGDSPLTMGPLMVHINDLKNDNNFVEKSKELGIRYGADLRGIIVADFDNDCDGDIISIDIAGEPIYFENRLGGKCTSIELKSNKNTSSHGAKLIVQTNKGSRIFENLSGGIWNSWRPGRIHIGLEEGEEILSYEVKYLNGSNINGKSLPINAINIIFPP